MKKCYIFLIAMLAAGCTSINVEKINAQKNNVEKNASKFEEMPSVGLSCGSKTRIEENLKMDILLKIQKSSDEKDQIREIWKYIKSEYRDGELTDGANVRDVNTIIRTKELKHCGEYGVLWLALLRVYGIPCEYIATLNLREASNLSMNSWSGHVLIYAFADNQYFLIDSTRGLIFKNYNSKDRLLPIKIIGFADEGLIEMFRCIDIGSYINNSKDYARYIDETKDYFIQNKRNPSYSLDTYRILDTNW